MATYVSRALSNVSHMAPGPEVWSRYQNDLWHWFKHAHPLFAGKIAIPAEIPGIGSPQQYLAMAREICRKAVAGEAGTEITVRETKGLREYLVWYEPSGYSRGLFLVVKDCGDHGELKTMFPPIDGRTYYEAQRGQALH
jgi:hypothetical protein